ncbi:MAG: hypothetical protein IPN30_03930 [Flavobacteriales bacterium]|nr:hypothetical protein [Flavobacteriales bacterium]
MSSPKLRDADPNFVEPRIMLAETPNNKARMTWRSNATGEVIAAAPNFFPVGRLHLADLEFKRGDYDQAEKNYKAYIAREEEPPRKAGRSLGWRIVRSQHVPFSSQCPSNP